MKYTMRTALITAAVLVLTPGVARAGLYVDPHSHAARQANVYAEHGRPQAAALMRRLSLVPQAAWMTGGSPKTVRRAVAKLMARAGEDLPVLVAYNVPQRDCGAGGARRYGRWIDGFANGIGRHRAIVILEPDALAALCGKRRIGTLRRAVARLQRVPNAHVYADAGHSNWQPARTMARRLKSVGAHDFSLNVANFRRTAELIAYGTEISRRLRGAHFVIDTSRNGRGPARTWCNPKRRGLGARPTTETGNPLVDALLWIKPPGESDGTCHGGPAAGRWWPGYALGLARRANPRL
jgi:endoglucanase